MEKGEGYQLELFSQGKGNIDAASRRANSQFLSYIRAYEKTILIIIGIAALSIASFALGVERGKKISLSRFNSHFDVAQSSAPKPVKITQAEKIAPVEIKVKEPAKAPQVMPPKFLEKQGYIIQLASYKNKSLADKEAQLLKNKGFTAVVMPRGSFSVLCVANITNKEKGLSLLTELKKQYGDCYMRRL